jgi:hypothetical protein
MRKGIKKIPVEKTALESRTPLDLAADGLFQDLSKWNRPRESFQKKLALKKVFPVSHLTAKWFIRYHLNLTVKGL